MESTKIFSVEEISEIQIKSSLSQVNVVAGSGPDIVLRWTDTRRRKTEVEQNGKTLFVKNRASVALYGIYGLIKLKEDKEPDLELPEAFRGSIRIESGDECVRVLGVGCPAALSVKTTVGAIEISAASLQSYQLSSQAGSITLRGVASESGIRASTGSGNIECVCTGDGQAYLMDCHSELGNCSLPNTVARGKKLLRLRSKTGAITVDFERPHGEGEV